MRAFFGFAIALAPVRAVDAEARFRCGSFGKDRVKIFFGKTGGCEVDDGPATSSSETSSFSSSSSQSQSSSHRRLKSGYFVQNQEDFSGFLWNHSLHSLFTCGEMERKIDGSDEDFDARHIHHPRSRHPSNHSRSFCPIRRNRSNGCNRRHPSRRHIVHSESEFYHRSQTQLEECQNELIPRNLKLETVAYQGKSFSSARQQRSDAPGSDSSFLETPNFRRDIAMESSCNPDPRSSVEVQTPGSGSAQLCSLHSS